MAEMTLSTIAEKLQKIDFAMLSTRTDGGAVASRPMSNNGDVKFNGDSFFFASAQTRTVSDIERDAEVGLTLSGAPGILGKPPLFIAIQGRAELIRNKTIFAEHWTKGLDYWFEEGIDTPELVLIKVHAQRLHYWNGEDEGELSL